VDANEEGLAGGNGKALGTDHAGASIVPEHRTGGARAQAGRLAFHPLADIFPLMEGDEFELLVADIKMNGLIEPIIMFDDQILDGRNRFRACRAAGVVPTYRPFQGDDPSAFVISVNLRRRHLTHEQKRAVIAKYLATAFEQSDRQIAKTVGVSDKTVGSVRADLEATAEIPQLKKTVGADGRARPRGPRARRQLRLEQRKARARGEEDGVMHVRTPGACPVPRRVTSEATPEDQEDDGDSEETCWRRGLLYRATNAAGEALYEDWSPFTVDSELVAAAERAAEAWEKTAAYLRELRQARLRSAPGPTIDPPDDPFEIPPMLDRTGGQR
jgi:ParB-like chromosome segregation protein Spo0J